MRKHKKNMCKLMILVQELKDLCRSHNIDAAKFNVKNDYVQLLIQNVFGK